MLNHETLNKIKYMKLTGTIEALQHQESADGYQEMAFHERLGLLVDWEFSKRQHNRLVRFVNLAKFQNSSACVENIKYEDDRHLDRNFILELASCNYIPHALNIIIVGPTGAGKSYLAQAQGQAACRHFLSTRCPQYRFLNSLNSSWRIFELLPFKYCIILLSASVGGQPTSIWTCSLLMPPLMILIPRASHPCTSSSLNLSATFPVSIWYRYLVVHMM